MAIPYGRQLLDEDDIAAVVAVLRGDWLTQGPAVEAFEEAVAEVCDAPYAVAFSSGTAALHAACHAAGVRSGDEVITSPLTFAASANAAAYVGATPTFADIDPATLNVSAETVVAARTARTRAVIPVYWHPWYRATYGYAHGLCPAAEYYYDGCLSLPCFPALTAEEQGTVIAAVRELAREAAA